MQYKGPLSTHLYFCRYLFEEDLEYMPNEVLQQQKIRITG
jgi:hypothetical protein